MVDPVEARQWSLPPLVLQELFENALKHNAFDRQSPLDVRVECEGSDLVISNRLRPPAAPVPSTRLGRNLDERMRLAVGRPLRWDTPGDRFVVQCHWHKLRQSSNRTTIVTTARSRPEPAVSGRWFHARFACAVWLPIW